MLACVKVLQYRLGSQSGPCIASTRSSWIRRKRLEDREITAELARYEAARDRVSHDLQALQQKVERQVSREAAAIFGVHEAILRDTAFTNRVRGWIVNDRFTAQAALQQLLDEYTRLFSRDQGRVPE